MKIRPIESDTGTVHIVNRYEEPENEQMVAVTRCSRVFEVDEMVDSEHIDEGELCGACK